MLIASLRLCCLVLLAVAMANGQQPPRPQGFGRSLLHAHNAYPEKGRWSDRIDRALDTGLSPIVIEQDIALATRGTASHSVVSHDAKLTGAEPTLEEHFFQRVRPLMERALAERREDRWPLVVLHLDFKTNETSHHRAVWDLLTRHQAWLTTADVDRDQGRISPFRPGPLLAITENGENQERDFVEWATAARQHLIFGSIPGPAVAASQDEAERARILISAPPQALVPAAATSYRRWVNFPWAVIEEGGPARAGAWTGEDEARLRSVVQYAHARGLFIRFYTLNGHAGATDRGWTASYNFGSLDAAQVRWRAAIAVQADLIATDQYEEFAAILQPRP